MQPLTKLMMSYGAYHQDSRNKKCHFWGIPLVTLAIFIPLGWFRFIHSDLPLMSLATLVFLAVMGYYLRLDVLATMFQLPFTIIPLGIADWIAQWSFGASFTAFVVIFLLGAVIQLLGHYYEGRRPALVDNLAQVFNAPLFLGCELMFLMGIRLELRAKMESAVVLPRAIAPGKTLA